MIRLAHIVNPVIVPPTSDLYVAQPITFESMRRAKQYAEGVVDVRLFTTQYEEDRSLFPDGFEATPDLDRSVQDVCSFAHQRKLPLLADILDRLHQASEGADYLIYTNTDIALMPHFYQTVAAILEDGYDAFVINRRTIPTDYKSPEQLPLMYAQAGEAHRGHDCFVFSRETYPDYVLGNVCLGAPGVGHALLLNLACHAKRFTEFKDLHLTFHIGNDKVWKSGDYADYVEFGRRQVDRVVETLERAFGPIEAIPAAAAYLPFWRRRPSKSLTGHFVRPITAVKRLWGVLRGKMNG